jgi:hypothetical protein
MPRVRHLRSAVRNSCIPRRPGHRSAVLGQLEHGRARCAFRRAKAGFVDNRDYSSRGGRQTVAAQRNNPLADIGRNYRRKGRAPRGWMSARARFAWRAGGYQRLSMIGVDKCPKTDDHRGADWPPHRLRSPSGSRLAAHVNVLAVLAKSAHRGGLAATPERLSLATYQSAPRAGQRRSRTEPVSWVIPCRCCRRRGYCGVLYVPGL